MEREQQRGRTEEEEDLVARSKKKIKAGGPGGNENGSPKVSLRDVMMGDRREEPDHDQ